MSKYKSLLYAGLVIILSAVIFFVLKSLSDSRYKKQLPVISDLQSLSLPVRTQVTEAFEIAMKSPTSRNMGRLGMTFHSSAIYDKAAVCYKLAGSRNSGKWVWNYYLGYLDKEMGDNAGVIENFSRVVSKKPENYLAWFYIAEGHQALGENDKAEELYKKIISEAPASPAGSAYSRKDYYSLRAYARFQLASIYLSSRKLDQAETTLKDLLRDQPSFGQAYRLLGSVYNMKGDQTAGSRNIVRAADMMIYTPPVDTMVDMLARNSRSEIYLLKQIDDAEKGGYSHFAAELVSNALQDIPDNKFVISKAIKIYLVMDLDKLAMPYFDRHLEYFKSDLSEIKMVADLCMKKSLFKQAERYYLQAAAIDPGDVNTHMSLALCIGNEGAKQAAADSINMLIKKYPDNLKVLTDGAYVMLMLGQKEKASSMLASLISHHPSDPKVLQLSGILLQQEGKEDKALEMFEASFKGNSQDLSTTRYLSELLMKNKMWEKALITFRKALESSPNDPNLQESLGSLLVFCPDEKLRNLSEGREYSERAFINKSSSASTMISAGMSLAQASSLLGDRKYACSIMAMTVEMAQKANAPSDFIQDLQRRLEQYKN
jgi:tetratricopeptide (TPR) repeat protein